MLRKAATVKRTLIVGFQAPRAGRKRLPLGGINRAIAFKGRRLVLTPSKYLATAYLPHSTAVLLLQLGLIDISQ